MRVQNWTKKNKRDIAISTLYHLNDYCLQLSIPNVRQCLVRLNTTTPTPLYGVYIIVELVHTIQCNIKQLHHYISSYDIMNADVVDYAKEHNMTIIEITHWED